LLLFASRLQGAEPVTRFVAQPGSKVSIKGGNDIHEFDIQGKEIQGEAEFIAGFPATATPGKTRARIEGFIPVRSLHYGPTVMDKSLYYHLKEGAHPRILFRFSDLSFKETPRTNGASFRFDAQGELAVAGVTNRISMPIELLMLADNKLKLTGSLPLKMSDFGIEPPQLKIAKSEARLNYVKYRDQVEVSIEWLLRQQPASAAKDRQ
jgi:hypothetical protein